MTWRLYNIPKLVLFGTATRSLLIRLLLFCLMTMMHPFLSRVVVTSDLKYTLTTLLSLLLLGFCPALSNSFTLTKSLSLSCRYAMACLLVSGSWVLPLMMFVTSSPSVAVICPMMALRAKEAVTDTLETSSVKHSEIKVWTLQLGLLLHGAGFLLPKSSGKLYFILPLT